MTPDKVVSCYRGERKPGAHKNTTGQQTVSTPLPVWGLTRDGQGGCTAEAMIFKNGETDPRNIMASVEELGGASVQRGRRFWRLAGHAA